MKKDEFYPVKLYFNEGTSLSVLFSDEKTRRYDVIELINALPRCKPLLDRKVFLKGKLDWGGITWTDEIDLDIEAVYYDGVIEENRDDVVEALLGFQIRYARMKKQLTQDGLSDISVIDQADISKIENGKLSPTLNTIKRIARALDTTITLTIK